MEDGEELEHSSWLLADPGLREKLWHACVCGVGCVCVHVLNFRAKTFYLDTAHRLCSHVTYFL